ncbi:hypothetical protein AVEN_149156-1 [Araneus ventricosus]|uniref:Uncharacterized protein n=1 Tax=Araneus ventricosus TaxID=182803 RepID=A0A4Y2MHZ7_ARAVE|nr:hypothetical protein AVEN_149156-1 [Araneus ventricosus]
MFVDRSSAIFQLTDAAPLALEEPLLGLVAGVDPLLRDHLHGRTAGPLTEVDREADVPALGLELPLEEGAGHLHPDGDHLLGEGADGQLEGARIGAQLLLVVAEHSHKSVLTNLPALTFDLRRKSAFAKGSGVMKLRAVGKRNNRQGSLQFLSPLLLPVWTPGLVSTREGGDFLVRRPRRNHVFSLPFLFNFLTYHSVNFRVTTDNFGKQNAFSIEAEKHGVNAFSQNEIEHLKCCDDDVITSGENSEDDIVALVNEENNAIVDSSSDMEEEQDEPWPSIADAKAF